MHVSVLDLLLLAHFPQDLYQINKSNEICPIVCRRSMQAHDNSTQKGIYSVKEETFPSFKFVF